MSTLSLNIDLQELAKLATSLGVDLPKNVAQVAGRAGLEATRRHLMARNTTHPNRLGGKRTHWWQQMARSLTLDIEGTAAVVTLTQIGAGLLIRGGKVTPKRRKVLAVPVHADAHGRTAGERSDLTPIYWKKNGKLRGGLVRNAHTRLVGGKNGKPLRRGRSIEGGELMYVFKDSVTIKGDPSILPDSAKLQEEAIRAIVDVIMARASRGGK